ncbi:MAG: 3'-5' exonuclease, partial [Promethearchaeota archaeon]
MAPPKKKLNSKKKPSKGFANLSQFMGAPAKKTSKKEKTKNPVPSTPQKTAPPIKKERPPQSPLPDPAPSPKTRPLQKKFFITDLQPFGDAKYPQNLPRQSREAQKSWHIRNLQQNHEIVQEMTEGILLTVDYDGGTNKAFAKFYDLSDQSIKIWIDTTGHQPYCYTKTSERDLEQFEPLLDHGGFDEMKTVKKMDLLTDQEIEVTQIFGFSPTDIGGANGFRDVLDGAWEARIRYHHSYIYDTKLIPGMSYSIKAGKVTPVPPKIDHKLEQQLLELFKDAPKEITQMAKNYHPIFTTPSLPVKRVAYDIEVAETKDGALPNPMLAKWPVISISFAATDGLKLVYVLDREDLETGGYPEEFPEDAQVFFFKSEKELLRESFRIFWQYPVIITFNGDNFDNTYLYHRAHRLKLVDMEIPIYVGRGGGMVTHNTDFKHSLHLDVFQFFANRSIKGYAFGGAYVRNSLEQVASSLLGAGKVKHEGTLIGKMTLADLVHYNLQDSLLTLELTTFNNNLVWDLIITLMRVTKLPFQDLFRLQISAWIRSLMYAEHRWANYLIPRMSELEARGKFSRENTEKFQGAYVIDPIPGAHYNVAVLDFSSLYPSIIKTKNLSYETVKCIHPECRDNMLPNSPYWACTKKMGIFAYVVGYLRDVRVNWFKPLSNNASISENERQSAKTMAAALKVFINGAYGVFGSPVFPFYYR